MIAGPIWNLAVTGVLFWALSPLRGEEKPAPLTYLRDVKPILDSKCVGCHSERNQKEIDLSGGLALDSFDSIMKGGVLVPGDARASEIGRRLREKDADSRMPRESPPLPEETITLIERWINEGAPRSEPEPGVATGTLNASRAGTLGAARTSLRPPRFRPARPLDLRIPTGLVIPPDFDFWPREAPREKLEFRVRIAPLPPISAAAFGGGEVGDLLAAGSHGTVTVWDLGRGEAARVLTAVPGTVHAVCFSPDGRLLAAGGGRAGENGVVAVFDTRSWKPVHRFTAHLEAVLDLAFSPDGALLASGSIDRTARVWDLRAGAEALTVGEHSDAVHGVAFAGGGKLLASAGADRSLKITDLESRRVVRTLSGHDRPILALAASPDGKMLVSSGLEPAIRFWSVAEGKTLHTRGGHGGRVEQVAFSRDGKRLASVGSDRTVRIWEGDGGKELKNLAGASEWLYSVDFDALGGRVAAGAWDGTLGIWSVEAGRLLGVLLQPAASDEGDLDWAVATPEGRFRASASLREVSRLGGSGSTGPEVPLRALGRFLSSPDRIVKALRGELLPPPRLKRERSF